MATDILSLTNPVFANFVFCAGILALKCLMMSVWTSRHRFAKKVFNTPEDYAGMGIKTGQKPPPGGDTDVERVRNAHRNDMENIFPFFTLGLLLVLTNPDPKMAIWLFRSFTAARLIHTVVYVNAIRQPARAFSFLIGMIANVAMGVIVVKTAYAYL